MLGVSAVNLYKTHISRDLNGRAGSACAYHTSCSGYVGEVLKEEGLGGALKGLARLQKCTPANDSQRIGRFLKYTANCPDEKLEQFFEFSDPAVKEHFLRFRQELLGAAYHLASKDDAKGVAAYDGAITKFLNEVHFTIADPARAGTATIPFRLSPRRKPKDLIKADYGTVANAVRSGVALLGAGVGALMGGVAGLVTGAAIGAADGFAAGLGIDHVRQQNRLKKYGAGAEGGNVKTRERASRLHQYLQQKVGLEVVSNVIGGGFGLIHGMVAGGLSASKGVGTMGRDMGKIAARNLTDDVLGLMLESKGEVVVEKAFQRNASPAHDHGHHDHDHDAHEHHGGAVTAKAEHLWEVLSQAPPELSPSPQAQPSKQGWQFAVFSDATPNDLESQEIRRVLEFERQLPVGTSARIHMRRDGLISPRLSGLLRAGKFVASAASLVMLSAGTISLSLVPSLLLRGLSLGTGISTLKEAFRDHRTHGEEFWNGRRVYELDGALPQEADKIQSQPVEQQRAVSAESSHRLSRDLQAAFSGTGHRVALFAGHANSYEKLAGYEPGVLAAGLADCAEKSGQKADLVVFDACKTATLEALAPLAQGANYALVSQLPVGKVGLPWHSILKELGNFEGSPQDLAQSIVDKYAGLESLPTLSVIDLGKLPRLRDELEALAPMLSPEEQAAMLDQKDLSQVRDEGVFKKLQRKLADLMPGSHSNDLQAMLRSLEARELNPSVREQVEKVKATLDEAVLTQASPGLGGLSVESPSLFFDDAEYVEKTGMENWGGMLADQQNLATRTVAPLGTLQREAATAVREAQKRLIFGRPE